jgi:hypothetical protein
MKYIKDTDGSFTIFHAPTTHADMAEIMDAEPESAGFVRIVDNRLECYGQSGTLGLSAAPEDSEDVNIWLEVSRDF